MSSPMCAWSRRLACALLVTMVAGCATVSTSPDPLKQAPAADESVVVVSVTANTGQVTAADSLWVRRMAPLADGQKPSEHILHQVVKGMARDTSLFVGTLPSGEYEVSRFDNSETRRFLVLNDSMRERIGRFAVLAGQPVDLGRLIVTPVNTRVTVGRSKKMPSNAALMQRFAPEHARLFPANAGTGWIGDRTATDRVEEYALARPVGAATLVPQSDGRVLTASRMGAVLERGNDGRWTVWHSPGLETLMDVMPLDQADARLVAVGEFSTLLRLAPGGRQLEPVDPGNLPAGNLLFVAGSPSAGWFLLQQSGTQVNLLHSPVLAAGQWTVQRSEATGVDVWSGANRVWAWRTEGGMAYATSAGAIHYLDFASGQWATRSSPNKSRLMGVSVNPDGSLGALTSPGGGFGGVFASTWISRDQAQTWREIETPFKVKVVAPLRTVDNRLLMAGGVFGSPELQLSQDEGTTWTKLADHRLDRTLTVLPSGMYFTVDAGQFGLFTIRSSTDQGTTWKIEYSTFDRAAFQVDEAARKK